VHRSQAVYVICSLTYLATHLADVPSATMRSDKCQRSVRGTIPERNGLLEGVALSFYGLAGRHPPVDSPRPGSPFGARPPSSRLRLDAASLPPALSQLPQGDSRRQSAEASLGCLPVRPTKRGGARRKTSLAGRGYAPHCGIGCWGTLYRLGAIFPCGSPIFAFSRWGGR
jgi:hypothetical protein